VDENGPVAFPSDLSTLSLDDLRALETRAVAEFNTLADDEDITDEGVDRLTELADGIKSVRATIQTHTVAAGKRSAKRDALVTDVRVAAQAEPEPEPELEPEPEPEPAPQVQAVTRRTSLARAQERAPAVPSNVGTGIATTITAAAPTSGVMIGQRFDDMTALADAMSTHSRSLVATHGRPSYLTVATVHNDFEYELDGERSTLQQVEALFNQIRSEDALEALVAGGGWCAPSELRYNFFNITCDDGMIDLPTFGVKRGGVRFPVSPSLADVFTGTFNNTTNPWLWVESDDILTVTGSPNKPCIRVPCSSFSEARLECYGICLTAGNLTDNAWPEQTKNFLKLLMSGHYHAQNQRYLAQMTALSTFAGIVTGGATTTGDSIWSDAPTAVGIAAQDIRTRFGLCDGDVLEVVFPRWVKDAMKSDMSRRSGVDPVNITDAMVNSQFSMYRVRVQWVQDYQVRGSGQFGGSTALLNWPATVDFMVYPAGTVMRGNGMTLDLGVVRDSVLNAENDHTAAWTEECHLIAMFGHQIRSYRLPVCVGGKVGGTYTACHAV